LEDFASAFGALLRAEQRQLQGNNKPLQHFAAGQQSNEHSAPLIGQRCHGASRLAPAFRNQIELRLGMD
jgi:hypothetical protein